MIANNVNLNKLADGTFSFKLIKYKDSPPHSPPKQHPKIAVMQDGFLLNIWSYSVMPSTHSASELQSLRNLFGQNLNTTTSYCVVWNARVGHLHKRESAVLSQQQKKKGRWDSEGIEKKFITESKL